MKARGAGLILLQDLITDEEILLCGPAGTGKTVSACMWLVRACHDFPGSQHLLCRAERSAMTDTILVTMDSVIGDTCPEVRRVNREQRHSYRLWGSEIVVAGLDDPAKCYGSAYGRIVVEEAIQIGKEPWELFGRAARDPKLRREGQGASAVPSQRLAVTNPGDPEHWLNRRATREPATRSVNTAADWWALQAYNRGKQDGKMRRMLSVHQDNPVFFDLQRWCWTPTGERYLASLRTMSGYRRDRMLDGRWVSGVGDPVFDEAGVAWLKAQRESAEKTRPTRVPAGTIMVQEKHGAVSGG